MITILLEQIIELIKGWISAFTGHAQHVEDKLDSIDSTASDIKDNTDSLPDIEDNTAAVITPISNIKSNTDSIASSNTTIANNTTAISNQVSAMSTNVGRAAAFAEDCANNSLNILDKVTTIASDTTQIRTDTGNMSLEQSKIYDAVKWLLADKETTETDTASNTITFNTDMTEDLVDLQVGIVATQSGSGDPSPDNVRAINGYSSVGLTVNGNAVSISLGDTYYGGVLDVVSGALRIEWYKKKLSDYAWTRGNMNTANTGRIFRHSFSSDTVTVNNNTLCDSLKKVNQSVWESLNLYEVTFISTGYFVFCVEDYATSAAMLADYGNIEFTVTLKTPIVINLTPEQIATIKGDNTITTDTNGDITVTYKESIKHYLDKQDN
jgi:hypothetical protein